MCAALGHLALCVLDNPSDSKWYGQRLFRPTLPTKWSFIQATQLENKLALETGTDKKVPCSWLLSASSLWEGIFWILRSHIENGRSMGSSHNFKNICHMGSSMSFELSNLI